MTLLELAIDAARAAGALLLERFGEPRTGVGTKSSATDMVSDADREAEELIVSIVRDARADDGFLGEESGESAGTSGVRWIIDPLDGTTNFLYGIPHWSVSIAAEDAGGLGVGVVFDAMRDELFATARSERASLNGVPISVSNADELSRALVLTGFSYLSDERAAQAAMLERILPNVRDIRRAGSAALDLCWVACGRADAYFEAPCHRWDGAAGELIVTEAGGRVSEMKAVGASGPGLIASGPALFEQMRALVERAAPH